MDFGIYGRAGKLISMSNKKAITYCCGAIIIGALTLWLQTLRAPQIIEEPTDFNFVQPAVVEDENLEFLRFRKEKMKLPPESGEVSLVAVGDIMLSRDVDSKMRLHGYGYPWEKVRDYIAAADISFGNLETAITPGRKINTNEMVFRADPKNADELAEVGFDVLSLANNHSMNFGQSGMNDTLGYLLEAGILPSGAGFEPQAYRPAYVERNGLRFAFLSFQSPQFVPRSYQAAKDRIGVAFTNTELMAAAVRDAGEKADFVIVSMHAGNEYVSRPNAEQVTFARAAIDAGAEMVIGHHPHVTQTVERYKGKYIFYSLGNFVFDQMWSLETRRGLMIKAYFNRGGVSKIDLLPMLIEDYSRPDFLEGEGEQAVLSRLQTDFVDWTSYYWDNGYRERHDNTIYAQKKNNNYNVTRVRVEDLDEDGELELYALKDGILTVRENAGVVWQSKDDWWVDDFAIADSNNDGKREINMSVWKPGNYGDSMPFWEEANNPAVKNHFFIYQYSGKGMAPLWLSSNLDAPNCAFEFSDIDNDGNRELIAIEGDYKDGALCRGRYAAVWQWREWGFYNEWRGREGITDLRIWRNN